MLPIDAPPHDDAWRASVRRRAVELGASDAAFLRPEQVVTAEWVRLKCLYGCPTVGRCLTCPPHSPTPSQTRAVLGEYESVLAVRFDVRPRDGDEYRAVTRLATRVGLQLERELFLAGSHKAFALAGGRPCDRGEACGDPAGCDSRDRLRPGPVGCGIDVFATSANAGWPLRVLRDALDSYHRLVLVLVD